MTLAVAAAATTGSPSQSSAFRPSIGDDLVYSSGTVIDADAGLVLTTAHSVWGATSLRLDTGVGVLHGRIVARAPCADLALLRDAAADPGPRRVGRHASPEGATTVVARSRDGRLVRADPAGRSRLAASAHQRWTTPVQVAGVMVVGCGEPSVRPWKSVQRLLDQLQPGPRRVYVGWRDQYRCAPGCTATPKPTILDIRERDAVLNAPVPATRLPGTEDLDR